MHVHRSNRAHFSNAYYIIWVNTFPDSMKKERYQNRAMEIATHISIFWTQKTKCSTDFFVHWHKNCCKNSTNWSIFRGCSSVFSVWCSIGRGKQKKPRENMCRLYKAIAHIYWTLLHPLSLLKMYGNTLRKVGFILFLCFDYLSMEADWINTKNKPYRWYKLMQIVVFIVGFFGVSFFFNMWDGFYSNLETFNSHMSSLLLLSSGWVLLLQLALNWRLSISTHSHTNGRLIHWARWFNYNYINYDVLFNKFGVKIVWHKVYHRRDQISPPLISAYNYVQYLSVNMITMKKTNSTAGKFCGRVISISSLASEWIALDYVSHKSITYLRKIASNFRFVHVI